jgi:hypothetical protein
MTTRGALCVCLVFLSLIAGCVIIALPLPFLSSPPAVVATPMASATPTATPTPVTAQSAAPTPVPAVLAQKQMCPIRREPLLADA